VDNDIADDGESGSAEARVAAKAGDFCAAQCDRLGRCDIEGLVPDEDCVSSCQHVFEEEFFDRGEACAAAAERYMGCISQSTCEDFADDVQICELSDAEEEACDEGGEPPMGGGIEDPEPGSPAGNGGGPALCVTSYSTGAAPGASTFSCDYGWEECTDDHSYSLSCVENEQGPPTCTCFFDGAQTAIFNLVELTCPSESDIKVACGFWVVGPDDTIASPDPTVRVTCNGGSGGGGPISGNGCSVDFADCDGSSYHVECTGSGGTERCTCYVDGQPTGSFRDPSGFCPSTGTEEELASVNAGCGWYIAY
jgi:hypothetical protein